MKDTELFRKRGIKVKAEHQSDGAQILTATDKRGATIATVFFKPAKPLDEALEKLAVCCGIKS